MEASRKPRVQSSDDPRSSHWHSGVTLLFFYPAPDRLKPVQKFWGPSVERKPQNPSIPRATAYRSYSAATTRGRIGAGGCCSGQQVTQPLPSWVNLPSMLSPQGVAARECEGVLAWDSSRDVAGLPTLPLSSLGPRQILSADYFLIYKWGKGQQWWFWIRHFQNWLHFRIMWGDF